MLDGTPNTYSTTAGTRYFDMPTGDTCRPRGRVTETQIPKQSLKVSARVITKTSFSDLNWKPKFLYVVTNLAAGGLIALGVLGCANLFLVPGFSQIGGSGLIAAGLFLLWAADNRLDRKKAELDFEKTAGQLTHSEQEKFALAYPPPTVPKNSPALSLLSAKNSPAISLLSAQAARSDSPYLDRSESPHPPPVNQELVVERFTPPNSVYITSDDDTDVG